MALHSVAVLLQEPVALFEYGVLAEVFGIDRVDEGIPAFDYRVCAEVPGPLDSGNGTTVTAAHPLASVADADLVAVPASSSARTPSPAVVQVLRDAVDRGAWVMSVCSGAFTLGAAGVLDGRKCTTHWQHAAELAAAHPLAQVDPDVLYVRDGTVITSAGTAAGIDAALYLVRTELGSAVATTIARRMVVPPHRDGGQAQYVDTPLPCDADTLAPLLAWMVENLEEELSVPDLAARAFVSERTFARRFRAETGTTPAAWITRQRVVRAQEMLERSDASIEEIARLCGFGTAAVLRHHFARTLGTSPQAYRRTFAPAPVS